MPCPGSRVCPYRMNGSGRSLKTMENRHTGRTGASEWVRPLAVLAEGFFGKAMNGMNGMKARWAECEDHALMRLVPYSPKKISVEISSTRLQPV